MKTHLSALPYALLLASFGGAASAQTMAPHPVPVAVDQVRDFVYLVRVSNPHLEPGQVKLVRTNDGSVLYWSATSYRPSFGHKLNISSLPDGQYTLLVQVGKEQHRYTLDLNTRLERTARLGSVSLTAMASPKPR